MNRTLTIRITTFIFFLVFLSCSSFATNYYTSPGPNDRSSIGFSFLKPSIPLPEFYDYGGFSFSTGSFLLSGRLPLSPSAGISIVIPVSNAGFDSDYQPSSSYRGLGNIQAQYQLIHSQSETGKSWLSFDIFLPTSSRDNFEALSVGPLTDLHYQQRYFPEVWTFGIQYARFSKFGPDNSAYHQYEFGGRVSMSSEGSGDTEFILHYAFALGLDNSEFSLGTELLGQFLVTGHDITFTERTTNQLVFGISYVKNSFQPKLYYQIPLDDIHNDLIGSVLGLGFDVYLD